MRGEWSGKVKGNEERRRRNKLGREEDKDSRGNERRGNKRSKNEKGKRKEVE